MSIFFLSYYSKGYLQNPIADTVNCLGLRL